MKKWFCVSVWYIYELISVCHVMHVVQKLTSTKNASIIITDFLAMIYQNEQPRTASLAMLENDFKLICR